MRNRSRLEPKIVAGACSALLIAGIGVTALLFYFAGGDVNAQFERHSTLGDQYFNNHHLRAAEAEYSVMIALRPDRSDGYVMRGQVECLLKNFGQGVRDAEAGMRLASTPADRAGCWHQRGDCYKGMRQWDRALADYNEAVKRGDSDIDLYISRATCYEQRRQYQNAARAFAGLIRADPTRADFYWHYAQNLADGGNLRGAIDAWRDMTERFPGDADVWNALGWYQYLSGDLSAAIVSAKKALALNTNAPYAGFNLGLYYAAQGRADLARPQYIKACQRAPASETAGALGEIVKALKKRPDSPALKAMRALVQSRLSASPARPSPPLNSKRP